MANELKPCPFCNSTDVSVNRMEKACMSWVSCKSCGLDTPSETGTTDDQAVSYWNTRPAATVEGLERYDISMFGNGAVEMGGGEYVRFEQAEAIIAALQSDIAGSASVIKHLTQRAEKAEADNAALTARVTELSDLIDGENCADPDKIDALFRRAETAETQLAAARKALESIANKCASFEHINLIGKNSTKAKRGGTLRNVMIIARAALEAKP